MDSRFFDARGSILNHVGHDQITINANSPIVHVHFSLFGSKQASSNSKDVASQSSPSAILSQENALVQNSCPAMAITVAETASSLIVQIINLLHDGQNSSINNRDLELDMKSTHQTLILAALALRAYDDSPLSPSLANAIGPKVVQCCAALRELLDKVDGTRRLSFTSIGDLWHLAWRSRWDGDELDSLRRDLFDVKKSLLMVLVALHSYVFILFH
jgi:hypothetical protein